MSDIATSESQTESDEKQLELHDVEVYDDLTD